MTWNLTNGRTVNGRAICDLYRDGNPLMSAVGYTAAFEHVLANGDSADTYQEDHMSEPQTVAELRTEQAEQERRFAQD